MPDWLERLRAPEASEPPTMEPSVEKAVAPDEEMEWLRELEEVEAPETIEVEGEIPAVHDVVRSHTLEVAEPEPAESAPAPAEPGVDDAQRNLALARTYLKEGTLDSAAKEYEYLTSIPSLHETVIRDLQEAVQTYPKHHALHRVLGDAYMRSGLLQQALSAYQQALTKL